MTTRLRLGRGIGAIAAFAATVAVVSLMLTVPWSSKSAEAAGQEHRILSGLGGTTDVLLSTFWHTSNTAVDIVDTAVPGGAGLVGRSVYHRSYHWSGATAAWATVIPDSSGCNGARVTYASIGGETWFWHINRSIGIGSGWTMATNGGYTLSPILGSIRTHVGDPCTSTGPHLHQGSSLGRNTAFIPSGLAAHATCAALGQPNCRLNPTGDPINRWIHKLTY